MDFYALLPRRIFQVLRGDFKIRGQRIDADAARAIARAIAGKPKYLLYDEPTSGLDPVNADIIDGLVQRLDDELGVTSVMVTHDVRGAFRVADRLGGEAREFIENDGELSVI